ncbi:tyrosine phosphatase-like protein [Mortierella sp. GBAus27b]|nr:tyrosine phosphatase-like protein [Mortierella sp. GBAus27b]
MPNTATASSSSGKKASKPANPIVTAYLIAYNAASFAGWFYVLFQTVKVLLETGYDYTKVYDVVGDHLVWVQTAALFEVLHAALGLVKSPVGTTAMQVASRLLLVWGICTWVPVPEVRTYWAFTTMAIAWSITECIRYPHYALGLIGVSPSFLVWCRYTFFFILYPVGAGSEAIEIYQAIPFAHAIHPAYVYFLWTMLAIYPPGFYVMYTHMIRQRKRYLGAAKTKKSE